MAASVRRQAGSSILTSQKMMPQNNFYINQYRQFSNDKKPEQEEAQEETKKEQPKKEEPKKEESGGSALPLVLGLGLLGAGGFMMMGGSGEK